MVCPDRKTVYRTDKRYVSSITRQIYHPTVSAQPFTYDFCPSHTFFSFFGRKIRTSPFSFFVLLRYNPEEKDHVERKLIPTSRNTLKRAR